MGSPHNLLLQRQSAKITSYRVAKNYFYFAQPVFLMFNFELLNEQ